MMYLDAEDVVCVDEADAAQDPLHALQLFLHHQALVLHSQPTRATTAKD
jgi:hypothetical protein